MENRIKKIGLVVMGNISVGGGYPKVVRDLISVLNEMNKDVYLLTPFKLDFRKIEQLYGGIKIKKVYYPSRLKAFFCIEDSLRRRLMKREFVKMAKEVDFIIDICGRIVDKYLPKDFPKNNYVIWALSAMPYKAEWTDTKDFKRNIKEIIKNLFALERDLPQKEYRIYALDKKTQMDLIKINHLNPEKECLYPLIDVSRLRCNNKSKRNQIVINGRIDPIKRIEESIEIFARGTKKHQNYKLIIIGGISPESNQYLRYLKKVIDKFKINKRIEIIRDPSFDRLRKELSKSRIVIDSQRLSNLTMTSIEAMAAGNIVLANKNGGTFTEVLKNGKYGYGFANIREGARILENILEKLKNNKVNTKKYIKRATFFSEENFRKRLKKILREL